ncbi:cytochrome P450 [Variovorax sp. JS1663]|uniref:cytochrome P450 n=1 Tax=Variovorax sp. JS1663 TaxID=1851577 RepID=UPI0013024D5C|nr:cytochrome P450 [Variovorax sp. JS1663]
MSTISERPHAAAATAGLPTSIGQLPGPKESLVLGHLLQLKIPRLHLQLEGWARTYGDIYRLRVARQQIVVISRTEDIATVLRARPDTWSRPRNFAAIARESDAFGLFAAEGDEWRRQRRMVMSGFDPEHLRNYMPTLTRVTRRLRRRWIAAAHEKAIMDLQGELMRYSVDAASGISYGIDINTLENAQSELHDNLKHMFPMVFHRMNLPFAYWRYFRLPSDIAHDRRIATLHRIIGRIIAQGRERLRQNPERREHPTDLLEAMLAARDADGSALSESDITGNVFTMLTASEDTTANTLAWTIYLLHEHPEAWQQLVEEARSVLGDAPVAQSLDELRQMRYAEACASEAMRLRPVAPLLILDAVHDTAIRDVHIPQGTRLYLLMRPGAVDDSTIDAARAFRPERWLADSAGSVHSPKRLSMPFGAGPRLCPGRYLAMLEIKLVLSMLARDFQLLEVATPDGTPPDEVLEFTMHPVGLHLRLGTDAGIPVD